MSHEQAVMREVMVKDPSTGSLIIVAPEDMDEDVARELHSWDRDIENESIETELDYRSKLRNIFPCLTERKVMSRTLQQLLEICGKTDKSLCKSVSSAVIKC